MVTNFDDTIMQAIMGDPMEPHSARVFKVAVRRALQMFNDGKITAQGALVLIDETMFDALGCVRAHELNSEMRAKGLLELSDAFGDS